MTMRAGVGAPRYTKGEKGTSLRQEACVVPPLPSRMLRPDVCMGVVASMSDVR